MYSYVTAENNAVSVMNVNNKVMGRTAKQCSESHSIKPRGAADSGDNSL